MDNLDTARTPCCGLIPEMEHGAWTPHDPADLCRDIVVYHGAPGRPARVQVQTQAGRTDLDPCNEIRNHSPDGFSWGYGGSGPSQLSLALAIHVTGDRDRGEAVYQALKWALVAKLDATKPWRLTRESVLQVVDDLEEQQPSLKADAMHLRDMREAGRPEDEVHDDLVAPDASRLAVDPEA